MANWTTEHYIKIIPRRKGDYGFCTIGGDYDNFKDEDERNLYYKNVCHKIIENLQEHYRDDEISRYEYDTDEALEEAEEKVDDLKYELKDIKQQIQDVINNAKDKKVVEILDELLKIVKNN